MTIEDAKAIIRHGVIDMNISTEILTADDNKRDPLALAIMYRFPIINPTVYFDRTLFAFDGDSNYTHSKDLVAWLRLRDTFDGVYKQPINFRIDGPNKTITLVTEVKTRSEDYSETYLILPDEHPEVEDGEYQYPVGKLITVACRCHVLRFHENQDVHSYVGSFKSQREALEQLEYANDQLQLKP